jgi:hypothetical protein
MAIGLNYCKRSAAKNVKISAKRRRDRTLKAEKTLLMQ